MLNLDAAPLRDCERLTRRSLLQVGSLAGLGISLPQLLASRKALAKGGTAALKGVYQYGESIDKKGFVIMDTPGYDPASVTGMVAGGANVCCFTTGRGSCFGCKPVPTIKIATNSPRAFSRPACSAPAGRVLTMRPRSNRPTSALLLPEPVTWRTNRRT